MLQAWDFVCIMDFEDKMNAGAKLLYPQNCVSEALLWSYKEVQGRESPNG